VSFLPIFSLEAQEGRLFSPLAYTKTFSMAAAALLSVTLVPALMVVFVRGRIVPEERNPLNRFLIWLYRPIIAVVLKAKVLTIVLAVAVLGITLWPASRLGSEFMPNLDGGTLFYMPTTLPWDLHHQGGGPAAIPGPDHQVLPGGSFGLRQGRPRLDGHRSSSPRTSGDLASPPIP
jgi:Cu/Ag efflux pump CusA